MSAENETPELKLPYPSSTGAIKNGAKNIQELAERVDLLLREQLTKVLKVAKLTVTETLQLPSESITESMLKALAVTTGKIKNEAVTENKIASEAVSESRLTAGVTEKLWNPKPSYSEVNTFRSVGTEYEPSATRPTFVTLRVQHNGSGGLLVLVNGVEILFMQMGVVEEYWYGSFFVPAGQKWKAEGPHVETIKSSYLIF